MSENLLSLYGRYNRESNYIITSYVGFTITGSFYGDTLNLDVLDGTAYFNIIVDHLESRVRIKPGSNILYSSRIESNHSFSITLSHEVDKPVSFNKLNGQLIVPTVKSLPIIEFIGDSLTVGYGNLSEGVVGAREDSYEEYTDTTRAYPFIAAKTLGYSPVITAYSGRGLVKNYLNSFQGETVPYYFKNLDSNFIPEIVVINLGTNDFSNSIDEISWKESYIDFVKYIKKRYNDPDIVLISPNLIAYDAIKYTAEITDCKFHTYNVPYSALNSHPNQAEHIVIANSLIEVING